MLTWHSPPPSEAGAFHLHLLEVGRMIIYTYACQSCRHIFDALVDSGREQPTCPMCRSKKTLLNPICRPSIRPANKKRGRVFDMSSGSCPCGCNSKRAGFAAAAV